MTDKEINEQFTAKVRRGIFKPVDRHLTNHDTAEDRLQDAICQVWWMFRRYIVERNTILDDAILVQKCKWSACDLGRSFVGAGRRRCNRDVPDPRAYRDGHVTVHRVDLLDPHETPEGESPMEVGLAEAEAACLERKMNSALDLKSWIGGLTHRDQGLMEMTMAGHALTRTAHEFMNWARTTRMPGAEVDPIRLIRAELEPSLGDVHVLDERLVAKLGEIVEIERGLRAAHPAEALTRLVVIIGHGDLRLPDRRLNNRRQVSVAVPGTYWQRVYAKTGCGSRVEVLAALARFAAARRPTPPRGLPRLGPSGGLSAPPRGRAASPQKR